MTRDVVLELDVAFLDVAPQLSGMLAGALRLHAELVGTATIGGIAKRVPCKGSLQWSPLGGRNGLVYTSSSRPTTARRCASTA
ncbi:MAG: hypothetical protein U1F43_36345 [Myxococcota bacterium]